MTASNYHYINTHYETHYEFENDHKPSWNIKLVGLTRCVVLLSAIYLHKGYLAIGTYPDLSLQITGLLMGGCPYIQVGWPEIPIMEGPEEAGKGSRTTIFYYELALFRYADHICNPME
jgi:hypothetical protein